ncbi:MAG: segregation/condensation protein A [Candidatus Krumholzibacteriota bacterium]|nr:segregation/condensation protein A [Candidatus Krumholzibacteriota bacterium]
MSYHVRLTQFEGPLDLLLHLIRRDKINVYDINISHITREYLSYIEIMQELQLEVAGEFFVMAATLMRIKAQMLLPRRPVGEEEEEDPREELVRNLLEYKRFKEAAKNFKEMEEDRRLVFTRPPADPPEDVSGEPPELSVSLFDLIEAFRKVMDDLRKQTPFRIEKESWTIEEKREAIGRRIREGSELLFSELFGRGTTRIEIIVTFLALLEMVRLGEVVARQMDRGGGIWLYRPGDAPRPGPGEETRDDEG